MLKEERQKHILQRITNNHRVYVTELSNEFEVSDDTLRRDLAELENRGLLTKVHGGAIAKSDISIEFTERLTMASSIKQKMAAKVIAFFKNGDVAILDGGTSNLEVAKQIPKDMELTIFTNSFPIVNVLLNHSKINLIFIGGTVFNSSQVTLGLTAYQALQNVRADWSIIGISDIHPHQGITCPNREEAMIKRAIIERGQKVIVMADSYKLGTARTYIVGSLGDIDYLVTEDDKIDYIKKNWPKYGYEVL